MFFICLGANHWASVENCKIFFDTFAREHNLDPENPDHWYYVKHKDIVAAGVRIN